MQLVDDDTVLEVNRDITEKKKIELALHETDERLHRIASIIEFSDDAIVGKNLNGIITDWNEGAERIFGYTAQEAVGQPITIIIPQDIGGPRASSAKSHFARDWLTRTPSD